MFTNRERYHIYTGQLTSLACLYSTVEGTIYIAI